MRIALISDLHGNEVALTTVLEDIDRAGVDRLVCLGDVATLGPRPREVLDLLRRRGATCILGNHDAFLLDPDLIRTYTEAPEVVNAVDWCRERLEPTDFDFLRSFVPRLEIPLEAGATLRVYHGSPRSNMEDILATTPTELLDTMLEGHTGPDMPGGQPVPGASGGQPAPGMPGGQPVPGASGGQPALIMAFGHTHLQMVRQHRGILLVNPGSVGLPFLEPPAGRAPTLMIHAEYALVEAAGGHVSVTLRRVPVDRAALRSAAASTDNPITPMLLAQYG